MGTVLQFPRLGQPQPGPDQAGLLVALETHRPSFYGIHRQVYSAAFPSFKDEAASASLQDLYRLANEQEDQDVKAAEDTYHKLLDHCPQHVEAHINLGRLLHERKEYAAALEHYQAATTWAPGEALGWFNLGVVLEDLGRRDDSYNAYKQCLFIDKQYTDAWYNLSRILDQDGNYVEAVRCLQEYRRLAKQRVG